MLKVLLCIPPDYEYTFPPLGTASLLAFLRKNGINAIQRDFNLEYREFLASHIHGRGFTFQKKKIFLKPLLRKFFQERVKYRYYSGLLARDNDGIFPYLPYDNNTNSSFYFTERLLASPYLRDYLGDSGENTFHQFYQEQKILDFLTKEKIGFLGISVISPSQAIAAFTLGRMVKKYLGYIHVTIGGQWVTLYRQALRKRKDFSFYFDSMIVFEGETPLLKLAKALASKRKKICIPNVILINNSAAGTEISAGEEDLNNLACPDFDGLALDKYDGAIEAGLTTVTYETSRGCYWLKCAYCVDLPLPKPAYRSKRAEFVARDIKELQEKYGIKYLMLGDPGMSPRQMLEVSREIIRQGIKIGFWCMARLDPGFNKHIFEIAAQAGLNRINFGFESASNSVCRLLNKGNEVKRSLRVIQDCASAGIHVGLQTMLGLPGETFQEGLKTVDFLISNREFISEATFNIYYLTPQNYVYLTPERYGISYNKKKALPFQFFIPFKNKKGMTAKQAFSLQVIYNTIFKRMDFKSEDPVLPDKPNILPKGKLEFRLNGESVSL